jgi:hypothetical protein
MATSRREAQDICEAQDLMRPESELTLILAARPPAAYRGHAERCATAPAMVGTPVRLWRKPLAE